MFVERLSTLLGGQVIKTVDHAFYDAYNMEHNSITYMKLGATTLKLMLTENPISAVPFCSTTLLMNYMTWDHICIGYPHYTFNQVGLVFPTFQDDYLRTMEYPQDAVKYMHRGYSMETLDPKRLAVGKTDVYQTPYTIQELVDWGESKCNIPELCPQTGRVFGDKYSIIIPLHGSRVQLPRDQLVWQRGGFGCGERCKTWNRWIIEVEGWHNEIRELTPF